MVLGLAIGSGSAKIYNDPLVGYSGERGILWRHSLSTAIAARELVPYSVTPTSPCTAFTAGILHDIGKTIISEFMTGVVTESAETLENYDFLKIEREKLGTDHCEVGAQLLSDWKLPQLLVDVVRSHHTPSLVVEEHRQLTYITHLADFIAVSLGQGTGADAFRYPIDQKHEEYIKISKSDFEKLVFRVETEFEKTRTSLVDNEPGKEPDSQPASEPDSESAI